MYRITYVHKNETEENPLYIPGDQDYCLTDGKLQMKCGKSGELDVSVPDVNPAKQDIVCLTDEVIFYRDDKELWRGRPVTVQLDFNNTGKLICEGILSYLYDTYYEPFEFEGSPKDFFRMVLENHNKYVDERKQFQVGEITVEDPNDYINRSSIYYDRTLNVLTEKLINDSLGGYFRARVDEDGTRYLDYLENYTGQASQRVEYGSNILDIAQEIEYSDLATVILPLGARLEDEDGMETDEYTTIASVNGGSIYYEDPEAVKEYGWICVSNEWDDVTIPSNLLDRAKTYLEQVTNAVASFTVNAVDLSLISENEKPINLGDYVYIRSVAHGINQYVQLTEMTIYPLAPENDELVFGADTSGITDLQRNSDRDVQTALGSLSMRVTNLTADVINAVYANIQNIIADTITTDYLEAIIAKMGYVTIDYLEDYYASIEYLEANYASITSLEVAFEDVELINADVANIKNVLAGNAGTGDLQTIVLTADNAYIEDAVIINALMNTVLASVLTAGVIYTDYINIANNEDQSLWIDGSTMQFTDENGVVRVQIGLDASGNYSYYLWDENGVLIWDAMGLTEAGLTGNGAIIKDAAVADDANISGYKLNIEELTSILNENAELILSAEQITIGGGTLDYALTEITQQIENLEALEGVDSVENYYILGGPDEPPWEPGEDGNASILGEMILGEAILGTSHWTTEQPKASEGEYVWFSQKITYVNGDVMWTTPTLLTDYYVRNAITIQQTELEVVQGQIQAKIWQTDIDEAISDQYAIITMLIDTIDLRVGTLETTANTLASQVADISINLDTITAEVREVYEWTSDALIDGVPYYAESDSPDYYPPFEWEDDQTAVLGEAVLGQMVLGVNGGAWSTQEPTFTDGKYIWLSYFCTHIDGTTYWTEPTLLTDSSVHEAMTELYSRYAQILIQVNSITAEVGNVWTTLTEEYATTQEIKAIIDETVTAEYATIMQEVSYNYVDKSTLDDYYTGSAVDALISASASATSGEILQQVSYTYATMDYVSDVLEDLDLNAVVSIDTYYAVSDSADVPGSTEEEEIYEADFTQGELPDGWGAYNDNYSGNTIDVYEHPTLGTCYRLVHGHSSRYPYLQSGYEVRLKSGNTYKFEAIVSTDDGFQANAIVSYGRVGQRTTSDYGDIRADQWTTLQYSQTMTAGGAYAIAFYNYSDPSYSVPIYLQSMKVYRIGDSIEANWVPDVPDVPAGKYLWMRYLVTYADGHSEWTEPFCLVGSSYTASIEQYVDSKMASISLSVSGGLGNTATITMTTNGSQIIQSLDLSKVRQAFADDQSAVTIAAGTVAFISNTLLITSTCLELDADGNLTINTNQFTLDTNGNATFSGNLSAPSGNIGGFTIGTSALYNGLSAIANRYSQSGVYVGTNGLAVSDGADAVWITSGSLYQGDGTNAVVMNNCRLTVCNASYTYTGDGGFDIYRSYLYGYHGTSSGYTAWLQISNTSEVVEIYGTLRVNGSTITGSDESLKKGLTPVEDPEAFTGERDYDKVVNSLEPVTFQYKEETGTKKHIGFTYQNAVQALEDGGIDPDECAMVQETTDPDTGETTGGIEYNDIVALLVYEIKKLKTEIQEMKGD